MNIRLIVILITAVAVNAIMKVGNLIKNTRPTLLLKTFDDMKGNIHEVNSFEDISPNKLLRYGVIRIKSTNSIIANEELAENVMTRNYLPALLQDSAHRRKYNIFYEVNFEDMVVYDEVSEWTPLGTCHYNGASTKTTYSQGWSVDFKGGLSAYISLSAILGIHPKFTYASNLDVGLSGSLSCDVLAGKTIQFQILTNFSTIKNVKQRKIKVKGDYMYTFGCFTKMEVDDWIEVEPYEVLNKRNVQTACVTDPKYLQC